MKYVRPLNMFLDLHKSKALQLRGRLLGLDVGDKYVGLAVSEPNNKIASPLSVLLRKKSTLGLMAQDFQSLIDEFSLVGFVVGFPFRRDQPGKCPPEALHVKLLIEDLCKTKKLKGMKYTYWDEGHTSKNAHFLLKPLSFHPVKEKTIVDKLAAVDILQGYLDYANRKLIADQKPSPVLKKPVGKDT